MTKFRVSMDALVTKLMKRSFVVRAINEAQAIEKAEEAFRKACASHVYTECPDTICIDSVQKEE